MKVASVAELRNNFATVSRWIYEGQTVTIQKRGRDFALLSPVGKKKRTAMEWPDHDARLSRLFPSGPIRGRSAEQVVSEIRGDC